MYFRKTGKVASRAFILLLLFVTCLLQVASPGVSSYSKASYIASSAVAVAAASSSASAAAASAASSGGGSASILRSMGHTQFLAMSMSMAVPFLPPEYTLLCKGLE
jgi:hypothetical protein